MNAEQLGVLMIFGNSGLIALAACVYYFYTDRYIRLVLFSLIFLAAFALWFYAAGTGLLNE